MIHDLIIIGGGQSALACGYYLHRTKIDYLILDAEPTCGGAWLHAWDSLTLFSPSEHSSLPGWPMLKSKGEFPSTATSRTICEMVSPFNRFVLASQQLTPPDSLHACPF